MGKTDWLGMGGGGGGLVGVRVAVCVTEWLAL